MSILSNEGHHAPVFYPKQDYTVVKYLDLVRFLSMLSKQSLFFCRVDKLEDKFEGTYSKATRKYMMAKLRSYTGTPHPGFNISAEQSEKNIQSDLDFALKMKSLHCVNCWNKKDIGENAALWKIYSDFNKGILIESSISKIKAAFETTVEDIQITEVEYISFQNDKQPWGNTNFPFLYKDNAYKYEDEIRLLHSITTPSGWEHNWADEEVEEGLYIKVDLMKLIDKVIISPYSPVWFKYLIEDILKRFEVNVPLLESSLSPQ